MCCSGSFCPSSSSVPAVSLSRMKCWRRCCRCVVVAVFAHPLAQYQVWANEAWSVGRDVCSCGSFYPSTSSVPAVSWWSVDTDVCRCVVLAGKSACVGYGDGAVKLWDLASGNALHSWQHATMPGQYLQLLNHSLLLMARSRTQCISDMLFPILSETCSSRGQPL